jgi:hypothetical protein
LALWKSLHGLDNYFHATNRNNAISTFDMPERQVGDYAQRLVKSLQSGEFVQLGDLITRRKFVNCLVNALLQQLNKG